VSLNRNGSALGVTATGTIEDTAVQKQRRGIMRSPGKTPIQRQGYGIADAFKKIAD
jgi:hypothetical protein